MSIGIDEAGAEGPRDQVQDRAARGRQGAGDGIGIDDGNGKLAQAGGDAGFAAAYAPGEGYD